MTTPSRRLLLALLAATALLATACGGAGDTTVDVGGSPGGDNAAGACLAGDPDCEDTGPLPSGDDSPGELPGDQPPPASGMCAPEQPDCEDTVVSPSEDGDGTHGEQDDEFDSEQAREEARELLGVPEDELPDDVRIGRRGEEQFALTEDYVLGRKTVELDDRPDDDVDGYVVTSVTVELPEGPETYNLEG